MDASIDGIAIVGRDKKLRYANEAFAKIFGFSRNDLRGTKVRSLASRCELRRLAREVRPSLRRDGRWRGDGLGHHREGHEIPLELSVASVGQEGTVVVVRDAIARKKLERHRDLIERASTLLAQSLDVEKTLDSIAGLMVPEMADWSAIVMFEPAGSRWIVRNSDPDRTAHVLSLCRANPVPLFQAVKSAVWRDVFAGKEVVLTEVTDAIIEEMAWSPEIAAFMRSGHARSAIVVPLRARDRLFGVIALVTTQESGRSHDDDRLALARDLAARAALALDNARLYSEAQQAARNREELVAMVSHELKNPLGAIILGTGVLQRKLQEHAEEATRRQAELIRNAANRMDGLIRDLLDLAKIQAGQVTLDRGRIEVQSLTKEAAALFEPLCAEKNQQIRIKMADPQAKVFADRDRILQVLFNLIGNSRKFTPAGGDIEVRTQQAIGGEISFEISDSGPGISEDALPKMFTRFCQSRRTAKLGSGLGLSISKGIIEAHGGKIWAQNRPGGCSFFFTLPAA